MPGFRCQVSGFMSQGSEQMTRLIQHECQQTSLLSAVLPTMVQLIRLTERLESALSSRSAMALPLFLAVFPEKVQLVRFSSPVFATVSPTTYALSPPPSALPSTPASLSLMVQRLRVSMKSPPPNATLSIPPTLLLLLLLIVQSFIVRELVPALALL